MRSLPELARVLHGLEGRGYGGYKQIAGRWGDERLELAIDHVQGDPFATPSRVRLCLPADVHGVPEALRRTATRRTAIADFLLRRFAGATARGGERSGSGKSGQIHVDAGDAEILPRSGCGFEGDTLELRFRVGLPGHGRRIAGRQAARLLTDDLPAAAQQIEWSRIDAQAAQRWVELVEDHAHLQAQLAEHGLVAFVRDGAILPRASGVSSAPMRDAVPFESPDALRVTLPTLHHGEVTGMGLPVGVTLITGGGFHGKTTLLEAICRGIDPHVPGDGREWVVSSPDAVKLRSEDGRAVVGVDLRPFITDLPSGAQGVARDTAAFCTPDASGSTSLAAAIIESLELGATALLLDEDSCATNLLIRDARMQALVARETITPLIDRVRPLHEQGGISTVLVVGGSGDYLEVADTVILMEAYRPQEVTARAREVAAAHPTGRAVIPASPPTNGRSDDASQTRGPTPDERADDASQTRGPTPDDPEAVRGPWHTQPRRPTLASFDPRRGRGNRSRVRARGLRELSFGEQTIDLSALEQLVDDSQARAIGVLLTWLGAHGRPGATLRTLVDDALSAAAERGLYGLDRLPELAGVRRYELGAAINRLRSLSLEGMSADASAPSRPRDPPGDPTPRDVADPPHEPDARRTGGRRHRGRSRR